MNLPTMVCALLALACVPAAWADEADAAATTVEAFNQAITARDMDAAMATLAEGAVQFQLRAVHPGMSDNPPLTADLAKTWQTVAAILFPMSEVYAREVTITQVITDGDLATVWVDTTTHTERKNNPEPMELAFSEVYLLVKQGTEWKIAGIADNRMPDTISVAARD